MSVLRLLVLLISLICINHTVASDYLIGISAWTGYPESVKAFKNALTEAGFVEGKNTTYLYRESGGNLDKQVDIAMEFSRLGVSLVYSLTTPGTIVVKERLPEETPIVFSVVTYPADSGLIESFEYSGNNLVGTSNFVPLKNYVRLLKSILPNIKSAAIFHRKGEPNSQIQSVNLIRLLKHEGIEVFDQQPSSIEEVSTMAEAILGKVDVLITTTDTLMQGGGELKLIDISRRHGIPILSSNKNGILNGSTFGPVADFGVLGNISGEMAAKILSKEAVPAELQSKIQNPPSILINRDAISLLNIEVPKSLPGILYVD